MHGHMQNTEFYIGKSACALLEHINVKRKEREREREREIQFSLSFSLYIRIRGLRRWFITRHEFRFTPRASRSTQNTSKELTTPRVHPSFPLHGSALPRVVHEAGGPLGSVLRDCFVALAAVPRHLSNWLTASSIIRLSAFLHIHPSTLWMFLCIHCVHWLKCTCTAHNNHVHFASVSVYHYTLCAEQWVLHSHPNECSAFRKSHCSTMSVSNGQWELVDDFDLWL